MLQISCIFLMGSFGLIARHHMVKTHISIMIIFNYPNEIIASKNCKSKVCTKKFTWIGAKHMRTFNTTLMINHQLLKLFCVLPSSSMTITRLNNTELYWCLSLSFIIKGSAIKQNYLQGFFKIFKIYRDFFNLKDLWRSFEIYVYIQIHIQI